MIKEYIGLIEMINLKTNEQKLTWKKEPQMKQAFYTVWDHKKILIDKYKASFGPSSLTTIFSVAVFEGESNALVLEILINDKNEDFKVGFDILNNLYWKLKNEFDKKEEEKFLPDIRTIIDKLKRL